MGVLDVGNEVFPCAMSGITSAQPICLSGPCQAMADNSQLTCSR